MSRRSFHNPTPKARKPEDAAVRLVHNHVHAHLARTATDPWVLVGAVAFRRERSDREVLARAALLPTLVVLAHEEALREDSRRTYEALLQRSRAAWGDAWAQALRVRAAHALQPWQTHRLPASLVLPHRFPEEFDQ